MWDSFSFETGVIGSPPYHFIALDFSDNNYDGLTQAIVKCGKNPVFDLINDDDKIVILEVTDVDRIRIIQSNSFVSFTQIVDLSELSFR